MADMRASLEKVRLVPLAILGFGLYRTWIFVTFMDPRIPLSVASASSAFHGATAVCAILLALLSGKLAPLSSKKWAVPVAVCAMSLCALANGVAANVDGAGFLLILGAPLGGAGVAVLILLWSELLACFNPLRIALYYSASLVLGELATVLLAGYCREYLVVISVLLPAVSGLCFLSLMGKVPEGDVPREPSRSFKAIPWKLMCLVAMFSFVYGYTTFALSGSIGREVVAFSLVALIVILCILREGRKANFENAYRYVLPALVCVPIMASLLAGGEARAFLSTMGYIAASTLTMVAVCGISYRTGVSALFLCGLERGLRYFARVLGAQAAAHEISFLPAVGVAEHSISLLALASLLVVILIVFSERDLFSRWGMPPAGKAEGCGDSNLDVVRLNIQGLGSAYGLTVREQEVLELLVRKKAVRRVADELFIAQGTVKSHVQHIYTKLDVHSRAELYRLVGVGDDASADEAED